MAGGALVLLFLLFGLALTVGLYALIRDETANPTVVDRTEAEREARERGGLRGGSDDDRTRPRSDADEAEADGWGVDSGWDE